MSPVRFRTAFASEIMISSVTAWMDDATSQ